MRANCAKHGLYGVNGFGQSLVLLAGRENPVDSKEPKIYILKHILFDSQNLMNLTSSVCLSANLCLGISNLQEDSSSQFIKHFS